MRIIIFIVFNLVSLISFPQSELGIGIVSINFDDKTVIDFYESSDLNEKVKTIEFFDDKSINSWNIKDLENHQKWLQPESLWLDYHQFSFRTCFDPYKTRVFF